MTFDPLWKTMKKKDITTYTLITKYNISKGTIDNLKHNRSVTLKTIHDLCEILDCKVQDIVQYKKSGEIKATNKSGDKK